MSYQSPRDLPYRGVDIITVNRLTRLANNLGLLQTNGVRSVPWSPKGSYDYEPDTRRDIDDECGLLKTSQITPDVYKMLYDREAVASRVVDIIPHECWKVQPTVYEDEDADTITKFEKAWDELGRRLSGYQGWYRDEKGSMIWEYLRRADILSGIGRYGVILLGFDDDQDLSMPIAGVEEAVYGKSSWQSDGSKAKNGSEKNGKPKSEDNGKGKSKSEKTKRELLFLRVFPENLAMVTAWEADERNPRFGQPTQYSLTFGDPNSYVGQVAEVGTMKTVHWSRVIHVADNLLASEILGVPRMQPVYNLLYGLRKIYNSAPEGYWKHAFPGLSFETHPQLGGDVEVDLSALRSMIQDYTNSLQRYMVTTGMAVKPISGSVQDPSTMVTMLIEAICIKIGVPMRIFLGSERGELASSQDERAWNERMHSRFLNYVSPRIICPFVDRLIVTGVLPEPSGYTIYREEPGALSATEKAAVAAQRIDAMTKFQSGGLESIMTVKDLYVRELGYQEEEAEEILQAVQEHLMEEQIQEASVQGVMGEATGAEAGGVGPDGQPLPPQPGQGEPQLDEEGNPIPGQPQLDDQGQPAQPGQPPFPPKPQGQFPPKPGQPPQGQFPPKPQGQFPPRPGQPPQGQFPPKPQGQFPPAQPQPQTQLNGAQISAAREIIKSVSSGETPEDVAVELLAAVGIPRETAQRMATSAAEARKLKEAADEKAMEIEKSEKAKTPGKVKPTVKPKATEEATDAEAPEKEAEAIAPSVDAEDDIKASEFLADEEDEEEEEEEPTKNAFCATGEGGGIDPSCGTDGGAAQPKAAATTQPKAAAAGKAGSAAKGTKAPAAGKAPSKASQGDESTRDLEEAVRKGSEGQPERVGLKAKNGKIVGKVEEGKIHKVSPKAQYALRQIGLSESDARASGIDPEKLAGMPTEKVHAVRDWIQGKRKIEGKTFDEFKQSKVAQAQAKAKASEATKPKAPEAPESAKGKAPEAKSQKPEAKSQAKAKAKKPVSAEEKAIKSMGWKNAKEAKANGVDPKAKHNTKLPKTKNRITIQQAEQALASLDIKIKKGSYDPSTKKTYYVLEFPKGPPKILGATEIRDFIYATSADHQETKTKKKAAKKQPVKNSLDDITFNEFELDYVENVFCPTGQGGGVDPSCSPGGATHHMLDLIQKNGGFTFIASSRKYRNIGEKGYAVAPFPERTYKTKPGQKLTLSRLKKYIDKNKDLLKQPGYAVGAWHDKSTGTVYLDVSIVMESKNAAKKLGQEKNQKSILDFRTGKEIPTGGTGEAVQNQGQAADDDPDRPGSVGRRTAEGSRPAARMTVHRSITGVTPRQAAGLIGSILTCNEPTPASFSPPTINEGLICSISFDESLNDIAVNTSAEEVLFPKGTRILFTGIVKDELIAEVL